MKLLAWDTSSKAGAIVALEWSSDVKGHGASDWKQVRLIAELSLNVDSTHSERLLWGIHQVLESARWKLEEVDYFGVGVGPGSFTGLRIGITTARTLAHTFKKPLVGVSSLAALARPVALHCAQAGAGAPLVIAATDACKGELFALWGTSVAISECAVHPDSTSISPSPSTSLWTSEAIEEVTSPELLVQEVKKKLEDQSGVSSWIAVGEGRSRYHESWNQLPLEQEVKDLFPFCHQVQGRYLGLLAWEAVQAGLTHEALSVHPRYLRASDAELKLKAGQLPKANPRNLN